MNILSLSLSYSNLHCSVSVLWKYFDTLATMTNRRTRLRIETTLLPTDVDFATKSMIFARLRWFNVFVNRLVEGARLSISFSQFSSRSKLWNKLIDPFWRKFILRIDRIWVTRMLSEFIFILCVYYINASQIFFSSYDPFSYIRFIILELWRKFSASCNPLSWIKVKRI